MSTEQQTGNIPLRDAFIRRDGRFRLLESGRQLAGWAPGSLLLEIGCADGAGAEYMAGLGYRVLAADIDATIIHSDREKQSSVKYLCADACALPLEDGSVDGIYSEAAFSVIPEKAAAAGEYSRILRPGGHILINDYALKTEMTAGRREVNGIPCLAGVQTTEAYTALFAAAGFRCLYASEENSELLRIAFSLSRIYRVKPADIPAYLVKNFGNDSFVDDFFAKAKMTYCQLVIEKK